jgi:putative endonuclease
MPTYYVYVLKSLKDGTYYKGFTTDYLERYKEHNSGRTRNPSNNRPWELLSFMGVIIYGRITQNKFQKSLEKIIKIVL